jgi:hypothetical protein
MSAAADRRSEDRLEMEDTQRAGEFLRAAHLAREWLTTTEGQPPERLTPFRCFVLGYLAAVRDRT